MILYRVLVLSPVNVDFLREKLLLMYANPLTNYLATQTDNPK